MELRQKLVSQFGNPRGAVGNVVGFIMSHRTSNRERIQWAVSLLDVRTGDHVLETGFGPGIAIQILSNLAPYGVVYGIDHSPLMVKQASRRNRSSVGTGHVKLMAASVSQLPSFGHKLDKVLDINSFQFWRSALCSPAGERKPASGRGHRHCPSTTKPGRNGKGLNPGSIPNCGKARGKRVRGRPYRAQGHEPVPTVWRHGQTAGMRGWSATDPS